MQPTINPRVKICCMGSVAEAWLAIGSGAAAVGLVSEMPSGPGVISEDLIAEIAAELPPAIGSFLLTCKTDPQAIIDQQRRLRVNTIQICDRLQLPSYEILRAGLPGVSLVQVVHDPVKRGQVDAFDDAHVVERHVEDLLGQRF